MAEQPGGRGQVLGAGGGVEEAAGVLVDAQRHQGGLGGGGHDALLLEEADEDGGGGAERLDPLQLAVQVVGAGRVVVVEVDAHPRVLQAVAHPADALRQTGVDDDQAVHPIRVDVPYLFEFIDVAEFLGEVIADAFFLRPGKHQLSLRVEPLGGDHGRQAVEIGADVAGDDVHGRDYTRPARSVKQPFSLVIQGICRIFCRVSQVSPKRFGAGRRPWAGAAGSGPGPEKVPSIILLLLDN